MSESFLLQALMYGAALGLLVRFFTLWRGGD